ncbi:uncharacterized protein LOC127870404 [Dreissena polymorpha]|uniref:uncharacterized protein LOC127870404 n=1 Tax=Dreissena polymorpha TaxID=45954 RepID=UPI0022651167|nr:uncharacterized protein LOC127870404 [Dreissena polymorpha]
MFTFLSRSQIISQETDQEEINNPPVLPGRIGVNYTEHEILAGNSSEYIDWNNPDSIEMQESHNNSEEVNIDQSVDTADTSSENRIISLNDLSAGPNVSPVIDDNNMGTENVPSFDRTEETTDSAIEERVIDDRRNTHLPYARIISERVFGEITEALLSK